MNTSEPLWYRLRAFFFMAAAWIGILIGDWIWRLLGHTGVSIFENVVWYQGVEGARILLMLAILPMLGGVALRIWASSYVHARTVLTRTADNDRLVTTGPFRFVRNPLYLGNLLILVGFIPIATPMGALLMFVTAFLAMRLAALREERALGISFGKRYIAYAAVVPRWFPRLNRLRSGSERANLREGMRSEVTALGLVAAELIGLAPIPHAQIVAITVFIAGFALQVYLNRELLRSA